jgi:hypothetical protein
MQSDGFKSARKLCRENYLDIIQKPQNLVSSQRKTKLNFRFADDICKLLCNMRPVGPVTLPIEASNHSIFLSIYQHSNA